MALKFASAKLAMTVKLRLLQSSLKMWNPAPVTIIRQEQHENKQYSEKNLARQNGLNCMPKMLQAFKVTELEN